jgi:hypothetical protein
LEVTATDSAGRQKRLQEDPGPRVAPILQPRLYTGRVQLRTEEDL